MKSVLQGKRYDTEKACEIFRVRHGESVTDFHYFDMGIFRTPRGRWFIAGRGGPLSRFARPVSSNSWQGGEKIVPVTPSEVLDLYEQNQEDIDCDYIFDYPEINALVVEG